MNRNRRRTTPLDVGSLNQALDRIQAEMAYLVSRGWMTERSRKVVEAELPKKFTMNREKSRPRVLNIAK